MLYLVNILVGPKEGIHNPEAVIIKRALETSLGFKGIKNIDIKRFFSYVTKQKTKESASEEAERICGSYFCDLSVNERYDIVSIEEIKRNFQKLL